MLDIGAAREPGWSTRFGGATIENFLERSYPWPGRITALSIDALPGFRRAHPAVQLVQGDGCRLPFVDGAFDFVFSNAVIEHVGDRRRQRDFVRECLRVAGRRVFICAPNRLFPHDNHVAIPLLHWLPRSCWARLSNDRSLHLLDPWSFVALFPGESSPRRVSPFWAPSIAVVATKRSG